MRERGKKLEGQRNALPPQIFNGEEHRGDYEDFDIANEDDNLEEFLGIPRKNPKAAPVKTGAVAPEVGRLEPGKLDIKQQEKPKNVNKEPVVEEVTAPVEEIIETEGAEESSSEGNDGDLDDQSSQDNGDSVNGDTETDSGFRDENESVETKSEDGDFETFQNSNEDESEDVSDANESNIPAEVKPKEVKETRDNVGDEDDSKNKKVIDDRDYGIATPDYDDDSSDFSSDEEDNVLEFMPDGEVVRKKSRGFKQLNNCKRFWKASLMLDKV